MCTLSWQIHDDHLSIVFNRDELLARQKAEPPKAEVIQNTAVLSPTDPEGGGTWIAANEHGMVFCLLNHYKSTSNDGKLGISGRSGMKPDNRQSSNDEKLDDEKKEAFSSRGLLVREISTVASLFDLHQILKNTDLKRYKPFVLIVFQGIQPPLQWLWNGRNLEEHIAQLPVISTSSLFPSISVKMRTRVFRKATEGFLKSLSDEQQLSMHCLRKPWPPAFSIAMRRSDRGTVSLTRIRLDADIVHMAYQPGDPATTLEKVSESQIPRKSQGTTLARTGIVHIKDKSVTSSGVQNYVHTNGTQSNITVSPEEQTAGNSYGRHITNRIDLKKILQDKNPELARKLPRWSVDLIKLLARESTLNKLLNTLQQVPCRRFAPAVLNHLGVQGRVDSDSVVLPHPENRPVFLANHPSGGIDGLLLLSWLLNHYSDIRMVVTDILWQIPPLRPYVVPIDRYQKNRQSVELLLQVFESDTPLLIFPAGETARKINGRIQEKPWQKMPVKLARQTGRCIVPVHLDGYNSSLFNGIALLRRLSGIKLNLEMLLLVHEFLNPVCRMVSVTTGPVFTGREIHQLGSNDSERATALQYICEELPANVRKELTPSIQKTVAS